MFREQPIIQAALNQKNETLTEFWFSEPSARIRTESTLLGRTVLMVDAEDAFTEMLAQQLKAIGLLVTIRNFNTSKLLEGNWDMVVMGPGPGDPRSISDERIVRVRATLTDLLTKHYPFFRGMSKSSDTLP